MDPSRSEFERELREALEHYFVALCDDSSGVMDLFGICGCAIKEKTPGQFGCVFYFSREDLNTQGHVELRHCLGTTVRIITNKFGTVILPVEYELVGEIKAQHALAT